MTSADHTPDRLGPYRLLDRIGEGGMGVVYLARDPEHRSVAVKILRPAVAGDPNARRRLAREVETMRRVRSPFVAEVIDTDVTGAVPYIVTQYVPGRTLDEVVTEEGPLGGARLIRLASGLAEALTAIHAAGVVHRDLKPGNVMLVNGEPVVIDFGIAQALDSTRLTMTGMFMGTPGYLSPEVIEGHNSTSFSDVHAWGATVAFAATGRPPFGTGSYETIFYRIINGQPDLAGVAPSMADLLAAALRRDPASRPAASQLISQAAALDARALPAVPVAGDSQWAAALSGAGTRADPAGAPAIAPGTRADEPPRYPIADAFAGGGVVGPGAAMGAGQAADYPPGAVARAAARPGTQPLAAGKIRAEDFADVLPPVSYPPAAPAGNGYPGVAVPGQDGFAGRAGTPAARGRPGTVDRAGDGAWAAPRGQPLLVLATIVIAVSLAVVLPVAGTVLALAALALLRASDLAHSGADQRKPFVTAAAFPFFVLRALLSTVLLAPLALAAAAVAGGAAFVAAPTGTLARALSVAAGALVAFYGYGPGSGRARRQLSRMFSAVVRNSGVQAVAVVAMCALAIAAVAAAITSAAAFWPLGEPTWSLLHVPSLPGVFGQLHGQLSRLHL
jgi:predicted Ser/Thr protein kinase